MRKLTAVCFALLITVSAVAAPNDSSERNTPNPVARVVKQIKNAIIRALDDIQPINPVPNAPTP